MTNIFDFRSKKKKAAPDSGFLKDADDTVKFGPCGRDVTLTGAPHGRLLPHPPFHCRDWNNQELANIYRVKKLLDAAGVHNSLERGLTDEGDPWCVFCTATGDVFIHLCKIDGRYVLDSPNLRAPISGRDFADLIAAFSMGALRRTTRASENGRRRVINLQPNGKIFLHPAVLLAALIWSIYLNSEELVMFAPEEGDTGGADELDQVALVNEAAQAPLSAEEEAEAALFMQPTALTAEHPAGARSSEDLREGLSWKETALKSAAMLAPAPIAVGLSSIAIALGLMNEGHFRAETEIESAGLDIGHREEESEGSEISNGAKAGADRPHQVDLAALLEATFDHATPEGAVRADLEADLEADVSPGLLLPAALLQPQLTDFVLELAAVTEDSWIEEDAAPKTSGSPGDLVGTTSQRSEKAPEAKSQEKVAEAVELAPPTAPPPAPSFDYASLFSLKSSFNANFKTFDIAGITVEATFDIEKTDLLTSDLIKSPSVAETIQDRTAADSGLSEEDSIDLAGAASDRYEPASLALSPFELIDLKAQRFINFMLSREEDLEIFAFNQELVLIDFAAFQGSPGETYSKSWSLADGGVVSTVGLRADFVEFDLIA